MPRLSKIGAAALAAFGWTGLSSVTASYLVVAGGGGGGNDNAGGGGAGGYQTGTTSLNPTLSYTVTVGSGGAGSTSAASRGTNGSTSSLSIVSITSVGGGGGGSDTAGARTGADGGSGGGGAGNNSSAGGTGTAGQGNNGGTGYFVAQNPSLGGGGGGAGAVGNNGNTGGNNAGGNGGNGLQSSISGTATYYAGGGGGGNQNGASTVATGGLGGGGNGGCTPTNTAPTNATANSGGGGGGGLNSGRNGSNGGSGIVIISYAGAQQFGGGVVTSSGGNTIHTFTTSGTLSPLSSLTASYLIVAGGGGGGGTSIFSGASGGGGAGGYLSGSSLTIDTNSIYVVTVGAGGGITTNANGTQGSNSSFSGYATSAIGGGYGGRVAIGGTGGSGGGAGYSVTSGAAGTSGQGNAGGGNDAVGGGGAGGGGASAASSSVVNSANGTAGGAGSASSISGSSVTYAGGGGGGAWTSGTAGSGGAGGGGAGGTNAGATATSGSVNTGGGGGGGGGTYNSVSGQAGSGGSGIVIISYPGSTPQMAGGTVTAAGGNIIHTFTSSGYLTPIVTLNNSLRFRSSANGYLNRTPASAGNRKTWTWSGWVKRGTLSSNQSLFTCYFANNDTSFLTISFTSDNINIGLWNTSILNTSAVYRDPSAWYHIVLAIDTTQATASNRAKLYVNGVQVTAFSSTGYPTQNTDLAVNAASAHYISTYDGTNYKFDGYMADINFVDGQALTPNSFGTFNGLGVWQPIRYGGSYGTNGFYLPFTNTTNTTTLGLDFSPQNNNWTANNFSLARSTYTSYTSSSGTYTVPAGITSLSYLVVAGGGGGASWGGGGGAGGLLQGTMAVTGGQTIAYSVGAGGAGALSTGSNGTSGSNSTFGALTAIGGGGGTADTTVKNGGSGGGSAFGTSGGPGTNVGLGTAGQGNNGGLSSATIPYQSGGGGAGAVGGNPTSASGNGGSGLTWVNGTTYAGGGGGGGGVNAGGNWNGGSGGSGGGGAGGTGGVGTSGTANTGGGGGASGRSTNTFFDAGNGGSGIIIIGTGSASTYDSMTDVPTLTSATTANYPTINPLDYNSTYLTLSAANLQQTYGGVSAAAASRATMTLPTTGKFYWEVTLTTIGTNNTTIRAGICSPTTAISGNSIDNGSTSYLQITNGQKRNNSTDSTYGAGFSNGQILQVLYDATAGAIYFGQNNSFANGSGSFNQAFSGATAAFTSLSGEFMPCFITYGGSDIAVNFGQRPFAYTPPSGFYPLNTYNLPTPTILDGDQYFDASLWTGNGASSQVVTNSGSMQPDFVWIKSRNQAFGHLLFDSVRGISLYLQSNSTGADTTDVNMVSSLNSNGFTVGSSGFTNGNTYTQVGWQWRASNTTAVTNTAGSIISTVSANTTAGFSIVTYTGNATSGATVGHGCQVGGIATAPSMVILKSRSLATNWYVYHSGLTSAAYQVYLNLPNQQDNSVTTAFNSVAPGATTFTLPGTGFGSNNSGATYVAYCFAQVAGYSAFGSYTGNGSTDGPFIFTGFRPRFVLLKVSSGTTANWVIVDTSRNTYNVANSQLNPDASDAEFSGSNIIDIVSNGFKLRNTPSTFNGNGNTYIYAAFAENPFKYANAR